MPASFANTKTASHGDGAPPAAAPSFWELEELIAKGHALDRALAIMISRREGTLEALPERSRNAASQEQADALRGPRALSA